LTHASSKRFSEQFGFSYELWISHYHCADRRTFNYSPLPIPLDKQTEIESKCSANWWGSIPNPTQAFHTRAPSKCSFIFFSKQILWHSFTNSKLGMSPLQILWVISKHNTFGFY
jgi:hypothetical protein